MIFDFTTGGESNIGLRRVVYAVPSALPTRGNFEHDTRGGRIVHWTMSATKSRGTMATLSEQRFRAITKAVSDPRRYEILQSIAGKKNCTCVELRRSFPISAATLSFHLKELESAGLITISRQGKFAHPSFRRDVWKTYLSRLAEL